MSHAGGQFSNREAIPNLIVWAPVQSRDPTLGLTIKKDKQGNAARNCQEIETDNAGAGQQGLPAHQVAAGNQPGGQAGIANAPPIGGTTATLPKEWSGIASALARLMTNITDANTARNLRWQRETNGETAKLATWKMEATSLPNLQFFAFMQPGEAYIVLGHSMATIYSTATDIATFHGKIVLFVGDRKGTRECTPVVLPPVCAFEWTKCKVLDDPTALQEWYADDKSQYGKLRDPQQGDDAQVDVKRASDDSVASPSSTTISKLQWASNAPRTAGGDRATPRKPRNDPRQWGRLGISQEVANCGSPDGWRTGYSKTQVTYRVQYKRHHNKR